MKLRTKSTRHEAALGYEKRYQDLQKKITATRMTKTDEKGRTKHGKAAASMVEVSDEKERSKHGKAAEAAVVEVTEENGKDEEILALINERRSIKKEDKERIGEVSNRINKCIKEKKRTAR